MPPLSTELVSEAVAWGPVLGFPVQEKIKWRGHKDDWGVLSISTVRKGWESWDCSAFFVQRRLKGIPLISTNCLREEIKMMRQGSFQWCPEPGKETSSTNWSAEGFLWTPGSSSVLCTCWSTGTDFPQRSAWKSPRAVWTWSWALCSSLQQGLGWMDPEVLTILSHYVILHVFKLRWLSLLLMKHLFWGVQKALGGGSMQSRWLSLQLARSQHTWRQGNVISRQWGCCLFFRRSHLVHCL